MLVLFYSIYQSYQHQNNKFGLYAVCARVNIIIFPILEWQFYFDFILPDIFLVWKKNIPNE